ncbi:DUF697 domain-containing protein [Roseovarius aestuarii]|nr:DUF697 domain-containing protein [Roseovarius aestuarii]
MHSLGLTTYITSTVHNYRDNNERNQIMVDKTKEVEVAEPSNEVVVPSRLDEARDIVRRQAAWSFGAGCIPLPVVDMAALLGVQVAMVNKLSNLYGVPFSQHTAKNIVGPLIGTVVPYGLTWGSLGSAIKGLPVIGGALGLLTMPAFSAAVSWAVGRVFIQHFEAGGTLLDFDPEKMKSHFKAEFESATKAKKTAA